MVQDAEAHAEEDKKAVELVTARNHCDALVHSVKKSLAEYGDKISADDKGKIEAALKDAEAAMKSDDKTEIEAKSQALATASHKLAEQMYAKEQAQQQQQAGGGEAKPEGGAKKEEGEVVDAEFEEVKDKKV